MILMTGFWKLQWISAVDWHVMKWRNWYEKHFAAFIIIVPSAVFPSPADTDADTEEQQAEYIEMVNEAISVLADTWNDAYWNEDYPEKEYIT